MDKPSLPIEREEPSGVRVVATAGMTPAILTELGWWMATQRECVSSILVWTTGGGLAGVTAHLDEHWESLREDVGREYLPARDEINVQILVDGSGIPIPDVRNRTDADLVATRIHRDVRALARAQTPLVGWFAGGRKTMSSALQSAFTLYGRPRDRLLHALVHEEIEKLPREEISGFAWPTQKWAEQTNVPVGSLVDVAEVPFLTLARYLVPEVSGGGWEEQWSELRELESVAEEIRAVLDPPVAHRERASRMLRFYARGACVHELRLTGALARFYARVIEGGDAGYIDRDRDGVANNTDQKNASLIRERFGALRYSILAPFCVQSAGRGEPYRVPAHFRVRSSV